MEEDVWNENVREASSIWLLMGKGYRISRSIRLQWFFQYLNKIISPKSPEEIVDSEEELEVLAILEGDNEHDLLATKQIQSSESIDQSLLRITPETRLTFLDRQYRFVYCIDMSPSMAMVDSKTGEVLVDDMFNSIKNSLTGLVQPFCVGNSPLELSPRLDITVLAHTYTDNKECQVLMQGFCLNSKNINDFLCKLRRKLRELCERLISGIVENKDKVDNSQGFQKNQTSLFHMIRDSLLALYLLPNNASAAIVVVTDGVFILENAYFTDALLAQCRNSQSVVSFLQVGTGFQRASVEFGFVPHCALMQFIATATSGAYLLQCPPIDTPEDNKMNMYHKALLCWNFQRDIDQGKVMITQDDISDYLIFPAWGDRTSLSSDPKYEQQFHMPVQPQQTTRYTGLELGTKISNLLSLRAREGYITDGIRFHQRQGGNYIIEVKLVWPWKENVTIEYIAKSQWPFDSVSNQTHVIINVSGQYEFLVDITQQKPKKQQSKKKPYRKIVLQRFEQTMRSLEQSDKLLVHLQSFSSQPLASKIPETIAKGSSVFCMASNTNSPVLSWQYGKGKKSSKSPEAVFAGFWKPVVSLDTKMWSKWFHCHRIRILMKHDRPITKELFVASATGQYASVPCRMSISAYNKLIKDWCDFTLLENHTYVKFLTHSDNDRPHSFCLLRLTPKGLCIIMRLAFLLGTPGIERSKVTEDFRKQLSTMSAQLDRSVQSSETQKGEEPCIIFLNKQFERILVKYDGIPDEIRGSSLPGSNSTTFSPVLQEASMELQQQQQGSPLTVFGQYLFNQRWVWSMNVNATTSFEAKSIAQILNTIMKQRLHEGFNFCSFGKGIVSLTKEVNVTVNSSEENISNCCTIQYIMFPPHQKLKHQEDSTESDGGVLHEFAPDLQMVVEVWVEPQMGTVDIPDSPLSYIHGSEYQRIPQKIFEMDAQIVTEMTSYLVLHKTCYDVILKEKMPERGTPIPDIPVNTFNSSNIVQIPLLFELLPLLRKSSFIVSVYPLLISLNEEHGKENDLLLEYLFKTLSHMNDVVLHLNDAENKQILHHLTQRCNNKKSIWLTDDRPPFHDAPHEEGGIGFECFLKSFGSSLVVTLVPATVADLTQLLGYAHASDKEERMLLPFFIFECHFDSLQTVPNEEASHADDVLQDYTKALNENEIIPRHINQKLPENKSKSIINYCQVIYDHFFWAMVSAVYSCLKKKLPLDPDDVSSSIEIFCEESTKEIDITRFLRILCNHYRSNTLIIDQCSIDDVVFPDYASGSQHLENKPLSRLQKRSSTSGSSSFKSSRTSLRLKNGECENVVLANEIKKLFMDLLGNYFQQVPDNPYYMFFNDGQSTDIEAEENQVADKVNAECEEEYETDSQDASSAHSSLTAFSHNPSEYLSDNLSSGPENEHAREEKNTDRMEEEEDNIFDSSDESCEERPMFLHLVCSVHYKANDEHVLRPIGVISLPTCLGEIFNSISESLGAIDPYSTSMTVTLDLICLSQPTEPQEDEDWKASKDFLLRRQNSSDSFYSNHTQESETAREKRLVSQVSRDESYIRQASDSIEHLPLKQRAAVENACREIEWLLEDEIASALRRQAPITEENLNRVAEHIRCSYSQNKNCVFQKKHFNFVTGLDNASKNCLLMFIMELESHNFGAFELKRIGKYYCIVSRPIIEEESDIGEPGPMDPGVMDKVKEKAKITRKGLGHRRSHSDFSSQRHEVITEKVKLREKKKPRKRVKSWPEFQDQLDVDANFIYGMDNPPQNQNVAKPYWEIDEDDDSEIFYLRSQRSSTSRDPSSASPFPYDTRELFQRSISFSEHNNKYEFRNESHKRFRSLPNINRSVITDDTLVPAEEEEDVALPENEAVVVDDQQSSFRAASQKGDLVDVDDEEKMLQPHPQFWLFLEIDEELVNVYFHHRQTEPSASVEHLKTSYTRLLEGMDQICKLVNQSTLLDHLYDTFSVHNLLIAEEDDELWNQSIENNINTSPKDVVFVKSRESQTTPFQSVVHGEYQFQPGYFECSLVWQHNISIHSRLSTITPKTGQSIAMNTVRSVLSQFQVHNRQNIFVIKEQQHNVVYVRLSEITTGETTPPDDSVFRPVEEASRAPSVSSLQVNREDGTVERMELERQDSYHSYQFMGPKYDDKSYTPEPPSQVSESKSISFSVYGIREPGHEIKNGVMSMITKKLDYNTLDLINQHIARNPKCRLSSKDVEFIQPPDKAPAKMLQLCVTEFGLKYLHATMFYFHQHLLKKYNTPRYALPDPVYHFKNYATYKQPRGTAEPITSNNTYLYNRRDKSEIGIGVVYVTLTDEEGRHVIAQPSFPNLQYHRASKEELTQIKEKLLQFKDYEELTEKDEDYMRNFIVQISIWENGDINIDQFANELKTFFNYALLDVFMEFHVLNTPICDIPTRLHCSHHSSRRDSVMHRRPSINLGRSGGQSSASSSATTPKFGKTSVSHTTSASSTGKRHFSEPGTPVRSDSPAVITTGREELKLITEVVGSFPKDYSGSPHEASPSDMNRPVKRTSSTDSKRDSPHLTSSGKRDSPAMRREGSFTKKESPVLQRKLSGRDSNHSPLTRKRSNSSRTSSVRSDNDLTTSYEAAVQHQLSTDDTTLPKNKVLTVKELEKLPLEKMSYVLVTDAEVREAVGNDGEKQKKSTWQELEIQRRLEIDKLKERRNHEHGLTGDLHANYFDHAGEIFEEILEAGNTCIHKQEGTLHHNYSMEFVMKEFAKDMLEKSPDMKPKIFKAVNRVVDGVTTRFFTLYGERTAVKTKEQGESSMDLPHRACVSLLPGEDTEFIVLGHNAHQWLLSIGTDVDELSDDEEGGSTQEQLGKQLFKPLQNNYNLSHSDRNKGLEAEFPSCITSDFVPRQKFFIAFFKNKKVTFYTYNFTSEITTALDKQLKRLYAWHNVRTHLNSCLFMQKLGLFHHKHFVRDCPDKEDADVASFASSSTHNHLVPLMKEVSPKARDRKSTDKHHSPSGVPIPEFDEIFRDNMPIKPMQRCQYFTFKDLVKRQSWQYQEVRNIKLNVAYQESRLKEIFDAWKQEGAHVPISEDKLHLLQRRSRYLHYCDAPVMFKDHEKFEICGVQNILKTEIGGDREPASKSKDTREPSTNEEAGKDDWYRELKSTLIQKYIQYLQTLGLFIVQITSKTSTQKGRGHQRTHSIRTANRTLEVTETANKPEQRPSVFRLQKTTNGGIILMDVFFKHNHLCYKMSAFQIRSLCTKMVTVTKSDVRQFFNDVNRYKDLTHLRSFTYDFHIREIQNHLSGRHSRFKKTYPVHKLMMLIIKEYPRPPKFCRCILAEGSISVPCSDDLTPATVYDYFILNANIYDLVKVQVSKEDSNLATSHILTYGYVSEKEPIQFPESWRTRRDKTEYDGNVAIHFSHSENVEVMNLPFFIALANKKEPYPRPHMFSNVSSLKRRQRGSSYADFHVDPDNVKPKTRVRFSDTSESNETVFIPEVHSAGALRRLPSWNSNLVEAQHHPRGNAIKTSSLRGSESDSSLPSTKIASSVSPGKVAVFRVSPDQHLSGGSPDSDASSEIMSRISNPTINSSTTQENYIQNELKFVNKELARVRDNLNDKVGRCLSNCWRDLLWYSLLIADTTCDEERKSRHKKTASEQHLYEQTIMSIDEWRKLHMIKELQKDLNHSSIAITYGTMKLLTGLVASYSMEKIEKRISEAFIYVQPGMQQQIVRNLITRYGSHCRKFISEDGDNTYLCILNPDDLDMFYLVMTSESQGIMEFSVIYRCRPSASPIQCKNEEVLSIKERNARRHIENVNTCLSYNMWMQLLPS